MGWVPWLGAPPWPLEPEGTEKSVCGLAWPLAFPCPIGACGKVTSPAGSPSSGYLGTLGGGGPLEGCWAHRIGVLWCGTSKRRARMARAQETVKVSEWAGANMSANCRPGCRAMQVYMLSKGGARGGRQPVHEAQIGGRPAPRLPGPLPLAKVGDGIGGAGTWWGTCLGGWS